MTARPKRSEPFQTRPVDNVQETLAVAEGETFK